MPETKLRELELVGGPQDGAKVRPVGGEIADVIHVGPKWLGDGFSAYTNGGPSKRFPSRYVRYGHSGRFLFQPKRGG